MLGRKWRKAARSNSFSNCVEARLHEGAVEVRDTKDRTGPVLRFTAAEWRAFLVGQRGPGR